MIPHVHATDPCPRCQDLEERIVWLEDELGWRKDNGRVLALKQAFRLSPKGAAILDMLYSAGGLPVPRHRLENANQQPDEEDGDYMCAENLVSVYVRRLRVSLGEDAVSTLRSRGYALSPSGMAAVRMTLEGL